MQPTLDDLIKLVPQYLDLPHGRVYFTIATWDRGWQACYCFDGFAERFLHEYGHSPQEAVSKILANLNLVEMLK